MNSLPICTLQLDKPGETLAPCVSGSGAKFVVGGRSILSVIKLSQYGKDAYGVERDEDSSSVCTGLQASPTSSLSNSNANSIQYTGGQFDTVHWNNDGQPTTVPEGQPTSVVQTTNPYYSPISTNTITSAGSIELQSGSLHGHNSPSSGGSPMPKLSSSMMNQSVRDQNGNLRSDHREGQPDLSTRSTATPTQGQSQQSTATPTQGQTPTHNTSELDPHTTWGLHNKSVIGPTMRPIFQRNNPNYSWGGASGSRMRPASSGGNIVAAAYAANNAANNYRGSDPHIIPHRGSDPHIIPNNIHANNIHANNNIHGGRGLLDINRGNLPNSLSRYRGFSSSFGSTGTFGVSHGISNATTQHFQNRYENTSGTFSRGSSRYDNSGTFGMGNTNTFGSMNTFGGSNFGSFRDPEVEYRFEKDKDLHAKLRISNTTCVFHPSVDGLIASGSTNGTVCLWDITQSSNYSPLVTKWSASSRCINNIEFLPSYSNNMTMSLITASQDGAVRHWTLRDPSKESDYHAGNPNGSSNNRMVFYKNFYDPQKSGNPNPYASVLEMVKPGRSAVRKLHAQKVSSATQQLLMAGEDGRVSLFEAGGSSIWSMKSAWQVASAPVYTVRFNHVSPMLFAAGTRDKRISIYDTRQPKVGISWVTSAPVGCIRWRPEHKDQPYGCPTKELPAGTWCWNFLASSSSVMDHQILVWDLRSALMPIFLFNSHKKGDPVHDFFWSTPDHIISVGKDSAIQLHALRSASEPRKQFSNTKAVCVINTNSNPTSTTSSQSTSSSHSIDSHSQEIITISNKISRNPRNVGLSMPIKYPEMLKAFPRDATQNDRRWDNAKKLDFMKYVKSRPYRRVNGSFTLKNNPTRFLHWVSSFREGGLWEPAFEPSTEKEEPPDEDLLTFNPDFLTNQFGTHVCNVAASERTPERSLASHGRIPGSNNAGGVSLDNTSGVLEQKAQTWSPNSNGVTPLSDDGFSNNTMMPSTSTMMPSSSGMPTTFQVGSTGSGGTGYQNSHCFETNVGDQKAEREKSHGEKSNKSHDGTEREKSCGTNDSTELYLTNLDQGRESKDSIGKDSIGLDSLVGHDLSKTHHTSNVVAGYASSLGASSLGGASLGAGGNVSGISSGSLINLMSGTPGVSLPGQSLPGHSASSTGITGLSGYSAGMSVGLSSESARTGSCSNLLSQYAGSNPNLLGSNPNFNLPGSNPNLLGANTISGKSDLTTQSNPEKPPPTEYKSLNIADFESKNNLSWPLKSGPLITRNVTKEEMQAFWYYKTKEWLEWCKINSFIDEEVYWDKLAALFSDSKDKTEDKAGNADSSALQTSSAEATSDVLYDTGKYTGEVGIDRNTGTDFKSDFRRREDSTERHSDLKSDLRGREDSIDALEREESDALEREESVSPLATPVPSVHSPIQSDCGASESSAELHPNNPNTGFPSHISPVYHFPYLSSKFLTEEQNAGIEEILENLQMRNDVASCVILVSLFNLTHLPKYKFKIVKWCEMVIELLSMLKLSVSKARFIRDCPILHIREKGYQSVSVACSYCRTPYLPQKVSYDICCPRCARKKSTCSRCGKDVKGHWTACQLCGHGGHLRCIIDWFKLRTACPAGCPCDCQHTIGGW